MDIETAIAALLDAYSKSGNVKTLLESINSNEKSLSDEEALNAWAYDNFEDNFFLGTHERDIYFEDHDISDYFELAELRQLDNEGAVSFFNERLDDLSERFRAFHYLEVENAILTIESVSHGQAGEWFSSLNIYKNAQEYKSHLRKIGYILIIDDEEKKLTTEKILSLHKKYILDRYQD